MQLTEYNLLKLPSYNSAMAKIDWESLLDQLPSWQVNCVEDIAQLNCNYKFKNFVEAMDFANKITEIAEQADHHPSITIEWGKVEVCWWSHNLKGLQLKDFIMAAMTDQIYNSQ